VERGAGTISWLTPPRTGSTLATASARGANGKVAGAIAGLHGTRGIALDPDGKIGYNEIVRLDAQSKKATAEWPLKDCDEPSGLAFDGTGGRLFSVCDKHMAVTDSTTGKSLANIAIGDGPDAAAWDAAHKLAISSNGQTGTLTVVEAGAHGYSVLENLLTQNGARTMGYDVATDRIYLSVAETGPGVAPTAENPHPRPSTVADSFSILVVGR
jgi:hypothetical protein